MKKLFRTIAGLFLAAAVQGSAQATVYDITAVLGGSSGFGASSFHYAGGSNPMSGPMVADIIEGRGLFGTYNDTTGALKATGLNIKGGHTFSLDGTLLFNAYGLLATNSILNLTVNSSWSKTLGFLPGYVCCGRSAYDPNSFRPFRDKMIMTLWGASFGDNVDFLSTGSYAGAKLGMDIRLKMKERQVPEPSVLAMLAIGLLGFVSRRFMVQQR